MDDPNVTYKTGFAELVERLGRLPTANECLPLHDAYKRAFTGLAAEVQKADREYKGKVFGKVSAAGPQSGFSRQPAPQARTGGEDARTREGQVGGPAAEEPLSGPNKPALASEGESVLTPYPASPALSERRYTAGRGPGGGVLATCVRCGREWERPKVKGRPAARCGECR